MKLRGSRKTCWPQGTRMASSSLQKTMCEFAFHSLQTTGIFQYSGMEALIRSQRENIAELDAAIAANRDEITKVSQHINIYLTLHSTLSLTTSVE